MAQKVNKDMIIADILAIDPEIANLLMAEGMHCVFCPSQSGESLADAAMVHGLEADDLIAKINEYLALKAE